MCQTGIGILSVSAKTSRSCSVATRSTSRRVQSKSRIQYSNSEFRSARLRRQRSPSIERKISNTTRFRQSRTTTSKSHSCGWHESSSGKFKSSVATSRRLTARPAIPLWSLSPLQRLHLPRCRLTRLSWTSTRRKWMMYVAISLCRALYLTIARSGRPNAIAGRG